MHSEFRQMAKSSKDSAFKTTSGKDLEINLTGLKRTMKQKFVGKLKTSHSSASSTTLQPRNQFCHLPFFTMIIGPSFPPHHFATHRGISNVPVMNLSFPGVKTPRRTPKGSGGSGEFTVPCLSCRPLWALSPLSCSSLAAAPAPTFLPRPAAQQRSELSFPAACSW